LLDSRLNIIPATGTSAEPDNQKEREQACRQ